MEADPEAPASAEKATTALEEQHGEAAPPASSDRSLMQKKRPREKKADRIFKSDAWRELFRCVEGGFECDWRESGSKNHQGHEHSTHLKSPEVSAMKKHMKRYHKEVHDAVMYALDQHKKPPIDDLRKVHLTTNADRPQHKQTLLAGRFEKRQRSSKHPDQEIALAAFIAENGISLRAFDSKSWLSFCTHAGIKTPSSSTLSQTTIPAIAQVIQESRDLQLKQARTVAFAIDGWDAGAQGHVLGAVAHAILPDWTLVRHIFSLTLITANATAPLLVALLRSKLDARIPGVSVCAVVSDGGANFKAAASTLVDEPFVCVCHSIQLAVRDLTKGMFFYSLLSVRISSCMQRLRSSRL